MEKAFVDAYLKLIKEEAEEDPKFDYTDFDVPNEKYNKLYWNESGNRWKIGLKKRGERRSDGTYTADLWGDTFTKKDGTTYVRWKLNDYNDAFDGSLDLMIDDATGGKIKVEEGQTAQSVIDDLVKKFKEGFAALNIRDDEDEDWDDDLGQRPY